MLENDVCRWEVGLDGKTRAMVNRSDGKNYAQPGTPVMIAGREQAVVAGLEDHAQRPKSWRLAFAGCDARVKARLEIRPRYFTLAVTEASGELNWLQLCNLRVTMTSIASSLVNAVWDERFAACVLACNDQTDGGSHGLLTARAYREFGIPGAKVRGRRRADRRDRAGGQAAGCDRDGRTGARVAASDHQRTCGSSGRRSDLPRISWSAD